MKSRNKAKTTARKEAARKTLKAIETLSQQHIKS